jgi:hypothetical protein
VGRPSTGESAKFWLSVLAELRSRGVADVCIVCCDGLTGLPDAICVVWPQATVQLCVVHYVDLGIMPTSRRELLVAALRAGTTKGQRVCRPLAGAGSNASARSCLHFYARRQHDMHQVSPCFAG